MKSRLREFAAFAQKHVRGAAIAVRWPMTKIFLLLTTLGLVPALVHCSTSACYDCGEVPAASFVMTGATECPRSVHLTRNALLDKLGGSFIGRRSANDAGAPTADAGGDGGGTTGAVETVQVRIEAMGDVVCEPGYYRGFGGWKPAAATSQAKITLQGSNQMWTGVVVGTVTRTSDEPTGNGASLLPITFSVGKADPKALGYTPKDPQATVYLRGVLSADGKLSLKIG